MIPGAPGGETKSNAERKVFRLLQETALKGYAFHSVGLPKHEKKAYSEADFIVVTQYGVLCLEVKGGQVDCSNGEWRYTDRYGNVTYKHEGPFDQAAGAMFALKNALMERVPWTSEISFATGVVFTDILFEGHDVSVIPEIVFDVGTKEPFEDYIKACHRYWNERNRRTLLPLTEKQKEELRRAIREDLHFVPPLRNVLDGVDEELLRLTEEQVSLFECLTDNKRIVISGPAGSGKTLIAFRYACRCAEQGKRVLYLVYNKMLAQYLNSLNVPENVTLIHFHGLMTKYIPVIQEQVKQQNYFNVVLPEQFEKYLSSHKMAPYDTLIVDEGQDLLNVRSISIFDKLLKSGMGGGNWALFYDKNQNIFNQAKFDRTLEQLYKYRPATFNLRKNCRNTIPIANFNRYCTRIDGGEASVLGDTVQFYSYESGAMDARLDELLEKLLQAEISMRDIIILSPVVLANSSMAKYSGKYKKQIEPFGGIFDLDKIHYATIQSFKGLDAKVAIAVDLQEAVEHDRDVLLYTLFSRARTMLYLVLPTEVSLAVQERVFEGSLDDGGR